MCHAVGYMRWPVEIGDSSTPHAGGAPAPGTRQRTNHEAETAHAVVGFCEFPGGIFIASSSFRPS